MKCRILTSFIVFVVSFIILNGMVYAAETATGKVTMIQARTNSEDIYFRIDPMPEGTAWFYILVGTNPVDGCANSTTNQSMNRAYSALLYAKSLSKNITLSYCTTSDGFGIVNKYVRIID
ncbi:MAG: hypothetical protein OQL19_11070 [Gammaproteobacteria bacterium]|nr:hypothetical protein [Gammaproteobacteria bacterium]